MWETSSIEMSTLRVKLNKISSDWHIARALLENEYKCIDKALNKIRTRYEFAVHLLDVHRMWCSMCPHPGWLPVRSNRDAASACFVEPIKYEIDRGFDSVDQENDQQQAKMYVSASTQTTEGMYGLQADATDMGLHVPDGHSEKEGEDNQNNVMSSEAALQLGMTSYNAGDGFLHADVNIAYAEKLPDKRGIKQEDCDASSQENEREERHREESGMEDWLHNNDEQFDKERKNQYSFLVIKQEKPSEEHYDGERGTDQSSFQQSHEEEFQTHHIGSIGKTDGYNQPSSSTYDERSAADSSQDPCDTDGRMIMHSRNEPSTSTQHFDAHGTKHTATAFCRDIRDAGMNSNNNFDRKQSNKYPDQKRLFYMSSYHRQLSTHICEKPYQSSEFEHRHTPKSHMGSQIEKRHFQCSLCSKAFVSNSKLSDHIRTHTGHRPYQCSICEKAYSTKGILSRHARTHTGERPFPCPFCSKRFTERGDMNKHLKTHTGEKPYRCPSCTKSYINKCDLSRHFRIHTGEKAYQCSVCMKTFSRNDVLLRHMRKHTADEF